jgi:hypothetical protein
VVKVKGFRTVQAARVNKAKGIHTVKVAKVKATDRHKADLQVLAEVEAEEWLPNHRHLHSRRSNLKLLPLAVDMAAAKLEYTQLIQGQ